MTLAWIPKNVTFVNKAAFDALVGREVVEPLAAVPVKMELVDAANAVDTMLRIVRERKNPA